jgi:hypothetical protein
MTLSIYDASVPVFVAMLTNMRAWLDKAAAEKEESALIEARLAEDMRPLPAQFQMASDSAKNCIARLAGIETPAMADTEASFAELRERCDKTIAFIQSVDPAAIDAGADREVSLRFPNGMGYTWTGRDYLTSFALPNFLFHATTAYAIMRAAGVSLGKPDFLQHLGPPSLMPEA